MNEVIIDGVNVAECKYFLYRNKEEISERSCGVGLVNCKGQDCLYKQLQRAKAELEQYRNKTPFIDCKTCSQVKDLKAENEKLKEKYLASLRDNAINTELKLINDNLKAENDKLKAENERLKADKKQLLKDCNSCNFHKYKQALEDIREIINKINEVLK